MPVPDVHALTARATELQSEQVPFVRATVVLAQPPTSARPGDTALILADGSIEGFVGGQCTEGSVRAAAMDVLCGGETLLLRVLPGGHAGFPEVRGARVEVNPCLSGGSLEIFLEPVLPAPLVCMVGETPIAGAVASMAESLGIASGSVGTLAGTVPPRGASAVVVASHGHDEPQSIRAALDAGVPYIGLVASRVRGQALVDAMGLTDEERSRVHTPAGLDIGARTPAEIALSIMAEVVQSIRGADVGPSPLLCAAAAPLRVVDPVCGMTVIAGAGTPHLLAGGVDIWFCSSGCRDRYAG